MSQRKQEVIVKQVFILMQDGDGDDFFEPEIVAVYGDKGAADHARDDLATRNSTARVETWEVQ